MSYQASLETSLFFHSAFPVLSQWQYWKSKHGALKTVWNICFLIQIRSVSGRCVNKLTSFICFTLLTFAACQLGPNESLSLEQRKSVLHKKSWWLRTSQAGWDKRLSGLNAKSFTVKESDWQVQWWKQQQTKPEPDWCGTSYSWRFS